MIKSTAQVIVNRVTSELGVEDSSLTTGLVTQLGEQSLSLLNALGEDLLRTHDWQFLLETATFVGDGTTESFPLPSNFGRIVNQTAWSTGDRLPMQGPLSPQQWGWVQFGIVSVGVFYRYRILGDELLVYPAPASGAELKFYYVSKNWVLDDDGVTYKDTVENPDDIPQFDRSLLIKGLKLRLWGQKGFDTTILGQEFSFMLEAEKAQNQGSSVISLSGSSDSILIDPRRNVSDGNW